MRGIYLVLCVPGLQHLYTGRIQALFSICDIKLVSNDFEVNHEDTEPYQFEQLARERFEHLITHIN